ncbi:hypothetical protein P8452_52454 [Trifolium repens]|nr:hypothetical protein P8452_52454 [Trifolium repens]
MFFTEILKRNSKRNPKLLVRSLPSATVRFRPDLYASVYLRPPPSTSVYLRPTPSSLFVLRSSVLLAIWKLLTTVLKHRIMRKRIMLVKLWIGKFHFKMQN